MNYNHPFEMIEAYLKGELSPSEKTDLEQRLKTDSEWRKEVLTLKFIQQVFQRFPLLSAQEIVNRLGEDFYDRKEQDLKPTEPTYSLEDLLDLFRPIEHLELEMVSRSNNTQQDSLQNRIVFPLPEIDCSGNQLIFEIFPPVEATLEVVVHDNLEQIIEIGNAVFLPETEHQTIQLPSNMLPGRYYWQISATDFEAQARYGSATGSFFIRKDLMPEGE
ncbi:MAG: hypothetical protein IPM47_21045 [Sphingobacteriales bacterium]|nr:MAG: hypothetical protein IPM47_21045 [Sphingobacteriales bacterium]